LHKWAKARGRRWLLLRLGIFGFRCLWLFYVFVPVVATLTAVLSILDLADNIRIELMSVSCLMRLERSPSVGRRGFPTISPAAGARSITVGGTAQGSVDTQPVRIVLAGRMFNMPKAFPLEFRNDVVAVARKGEASIAQVARTSVSPSRACSVGSSSTTSRPASARASRAMNQLSCVS
jgi:hypothetical protein